MREPGVFINEYLEQHDVVKHWLTASIGATLGAEFNEAEVIAEAGWTEDGTDVKGFIGCVSGRWVLARVERRRGRDDGPYEAATATLHLGALDGISVREWDLHKAHPDEPDSVALERIDLRHAAFPSGIVSIDLTHETDEGRAELRNALLRAAKLA